jgi:hypothetical protein
MTLIRKDRVIARDRGIGRGLPLIYTDNTDRRGKPKARIYRGFCADGRGSELPSFRKERERMGHTAHQGLTNPKLQSKLWVF